MGIKLRHQEIYDRIAEGLITHATGAIFKDFWTRAVQINALENEYTYDLFASAYDEEDDEEYCFIVSVNNERIRVVNDNRGLHFTSVTYYFSGCRVAIAKEDEKVIHS